MQRLGGVVGGGMETRGTFWGRERVDLEGGFGWIRNWRGWDAVQYTANLNPIPGLALYGML